MTFRQEMFCWAYLECFCVGAEAARRIGYKPRWARCQASRVLRRKDVQAYLKHIRDLTSHPRCLACGQPLMEYTGHSVRVKVEMTRVRPILEAWQRAMWRMDDNE
jgi:phage terminase small subunit